MLRLATVKRFEELDIWQASRSLANRIYDVTGQQRLKADRDLCSQMQRASVSIMSNIAEGFERGTNKEFIRYLIIFRGSAGEVRSQLYIALDREYITVESFNEMNGDCLRLSRQIASFIAYLRGAERTGQVLREERSVYMEDSEQSEDM